MHQLQTHWILCTLALDSVPSRCLHTSTEQAAQSLPVGGMGSCHSLPFGIMPILRVGGMGPLILAARALLLHVHLVRGLKGGHLFGLGWVGGSVEVDVLRTAGQLSGV